MVTPLTTVVVNYLNGLGLDSKHETSVHKKGKVVGQSSGGIL